MQKKSKKQKKRVQTKKSVSLPEPLPEFKMNIEKAISYIKARTVLLDWLQNGYTIGSKSYQLRKGLNQRSFILLGEPNHLELFISVNDCSIQDVVEAFDNAISPGSRERGINDQDLAAVKITPVKYKK